MWMPTGEHQGQDGAWRVLGLMTLDQILLGSGTKPCVDAIPHLTIKDAPRTHVRELMVDPARTFIPWRN